MDRERLREKRIGVLMGGMSAEREISIKTGRAVFDALKRLGYDVVAIDVDRDILERLVRESIDVAFIALHGRYGEDGCIQGVLEILGIPYTGSGVCASALALNKIMTKRILGAMGIATPPFDIIEPCSEADAVDISFPMIVKPVNEGSTIGVKKVEDRLGLKDAVEEARQYSSSVLVEEFIDGREITFGILDERVFPPVEIRPKEGFYDYSAKYNPGRTEYIVPAELEPEISEKAKKVAVDTYNAIGCRGAARVDMILDERGPWVLEINTIPGLTETSLLPKAASVDGIDFDSLVEEMLLSARLGG